MEAYISAATVVAFRQLVAINLECGTPKMEEWLRSDVAQPVLTEILLRVPCSETLH
jgi:hypothetical protein